MGLYFLFEYKVILMPMFPGVFFKKAELGSTGFNLIIWESDFGKVINFFATLVSTSINIG